MAKKKKKPMKKPLPKQPKAAWTVEQRVEFAKQIDWRTEPTRWAFLYLTDDERQARTEEYVQEIVSSVVRGGIQSGSTSVVNLGTGKSKTVKISDETRISQTLMSLTSTRFDISFGLDADHLHDDSWDSHMALVATMQVDWYQLAPAFDQPD